MSVGTISVCLQYRYIHVLCKYEMLYMNLRSSDKADTYH